MIALLAHRFVIRFANTIAYALLLTILQTMAFGQIGETKTDLTTRFGKPYEPAGERCFVFNRDNLLIMVEFNSSGKADQVMYSKTDGNAVVDLTRKEAETLARQTLGPRIVEKVTDSSVLWVKPDESVIAVYPTQNGVGFLLVRTKEKASQPDPFETAAETEKKATEGDMDSMRKIAKAHEGTRKSLMWELELAKRGDPEFQHIIGSRYATGRDVPKDTSIAAEWFKKGADQDHLQSKLSLALAHLFGSGVEENVDEAFALVQKPAEEGDSMAQLLLGRCYRLKGENAKAVDWFTRSANQGITISQIELVKCYFVGLGVPKSFATAYKWALVAAASGDVDASERVDALEQLLTSSQLAEGQRLASNFKAVSEETSNSGLNFKERSSGTGFFVTQLGHIVTSAHVVAGSKKVVVKQNRIASDAQIIGIDAANDLALLKVDTHSNALAVKPSSTATMGAFVATLGFPNPDIQGSEPKFSSGDISSLSGIKDDPKYFQVSVPLQSGNSGGPLVDKSANVVGIVAAKLDHLSALVATGSAPENVNYAVKSSYLLSFLEAYPDVYSILHTESTRALTPDQLAEQLSQSCILVEAHR